MALTPFEALCGFRDPAESAEALAALGVPALAPVVAALRAGPAGLRDGRADAARLAGAGARRPAAPRCVAAPPPDGPDADAGSRALAQGVPGRPGCAGRAAAATTCGWSRGRRSGCRAGNLHAYLRGCGVEIMAASDNVLRGGLTPKHVDVDELLRVLRFEVLDDPVRGRAAGRPGGGLLAGAGRRLRAAPGARRCGRAGGHAAAARPAGGALRVPARSRWTTVPAR